MEGFFKVVNGILICLGLVFGFFGSMFLIAATVEETVMRSIIGTVFIGLMIGLFLIVRMRIKAVVNPVISISGKINVSGLRCKYCGGALDEKSLKYNSTTGSITVKCPYCNATYEVVEEVKW
ncbi:MAG: hypothetical protein QXL15_01925 [Candidatus Korarchaeota archaeon]